MAGPTTRHIKLKATTDSDGKGLAELRDDLLKASKGADQLTTSLDKTEAEAKTLGAQIARTKKEIRELGEEFERTGDQSLFGDLRRQRAHLKQLEQIASESGGRISDALKGAVDFGGRGLRPRNIAIAGIVEAVALAAPTIGAMIAGAVTGAVGLGGIAGGIAAASNSPAVRQAAKNFATNIGAAFGQYGDAFVEPLVNAFQTLEQGFHSMGLEAFFEKTAAYVDDIARGLAGFGRNMMPGLMSTLDKAGPILAILGRELPRLGKAFGDMFATIASGKGTVEGFYFLLGTIKFTFEALGATIKWLSDRFYDWMVFVKNLSGALEDTTLGPFSEQMARINDMTEDFLNKGNEAPQVLNTISREFNVAGQSAETTAASINRVADSLRNAQAASLALSDATLAYQADLIAMKQQVKETGTSLDATTEKGNRNRQMINRMVGDLMRERDAAIEAADGNQTKVDRANAAYASQMKKLQDLMVRLGFEKGLIEQLIGAYKRIPPRITTEIIQEYKTKGKPAGEHSGVRYGEREGRAHGGPVLPGVEYAINEHLHGGAKVETVTFGQTGVVHPPSTTLRPVQGGGNQYNITVNIPPSVHPRDAAREQVNALRQYERANTSAWRSS
jgi:predicted  nucleic acid-binding Zn-ribbon protein